MSRSVRIASRDQFHEALAKARAEVHRFAQREPKNPAWPFAGEMLETMASQTNGREPALDERRAAKLGAFVDRELEPPDSDELSALNLLLKAINLYFVVWPPNGVDPEEMPEDEFLARL